MNISDLLASLASGKGLNITPGNPAMDLTQLVSQVGQGGAPQAAMPMVPSMPTSQPAALPGAPVGAMNLDPQAQASNAAQTGGGYMNLGSGLQGNLRTPQPPPETELTAPKGTSPITTGSIAPASTPQSAPPMALGGSQTPDFSHSFGEGLINVGNALQGRGVEDLNADTLSKNATYAALIKKGIDPTTAEAVVRNPSLMKSVIPTVFGGGKYGKQGTVFQDPASGQFFTAQFAEDGTRLITPLTTAGGTALEPSRGVKTVDTGTGTRIVSGATGNDLREIPKDLAGAETAKVVGRETGEGQMNLPKSKIALEQAKIQNDVVTDNIDKAIKDADGYTSGLTGAVTSNIPGTKSYDLANTLNTVKANLGFDKLQDMRNNSPTGGALGQVSEMENRLLQSVWGSVEQSQSPAQLKANLGKIKQLRQQYQSLKKQAYDQDVARFGKANVPDPETGQLPQSAAPQAAAPEAPKSGNYRFNPETGTLEPME